ncbi:Nucleotidyltransferase [Sistotremastrum suecicum HHB10207 ss-3]|uniref:DNA polymerase n=1 Tax=Sistotremastrum suecicum HHB10207 ss-3 TaxID=1314776 RepID=A0A165Z2P2_9AGAM|nr:Nucleotidyltransferase [Sistotremastrum suecicum HHB10207 ss-3]
MPFKRPRPPPVPHASNSSSTSTLLSTNHEHKRLRRGCLHGIKAYILSAKIDGAEYESLIGEAEENGAEICKTPAEADIIVTAIGMKKRLERHIDWNMAKGKAVVRPDWIRDSVKKSEALPCGDYAAISDLHDSSVENCPKSSSSQSQPPDQAEASTSQHQSTKESTLPDLVYEPRYKSRFACERYSPLICPNQDLVKELHIIKLAREMESEERSALSYSRAISVTFPEKIKSMSQISDIPYLGDKLTGMIQEFLSKSTISQARQLSSDTRYQTLISFTSVYGIGPHTARHLYDLGLRTFDDLSRYLGSDDNAEGSGGSFAWREGLRLRDELSVKIPRAEVEEMGRLVDRALQDILPGSESTICGGYRRGKLESNDVDIVFTHPQGQGNKANNMVARLVERMRKDGLITHTMRESRSLRPATNHDGWDTLDKSLTIFNLPKTSPYYKGIHRRLDLIYAPREVYWTAVVGWTGSTMFERDLRLWAKQKGLKFDSSGITRRRDTKALYATSERDVFKLLELEWIEPRLRNADL